MSNLRGFKQKLANISRRWAEKDYDAALVEIEALLKTWPGNAHLHVLWASLVQLQEHPQHSLGEAKQALQQAAKLDETSPAAAIELGHFLDNVEDDPQAAARAYAEGVAAARRLLLDGLIGQAKAFRQLGRRQEFLRCLLEVLHLARFDSGRKKARAEGPGAEVLFESPPGHFQVLRLSGPHAEQIQELLAETSADGDGRNRR